MIFVTVGTTYKFDELVREVDSIAEVLSDKFIVQIGRGKYLPKKCRYFRFASNLTPYFKRADLIIAHGGAGTSFDVLNLGKKLISVDNPNVNDSHQPDILNKLTKEKYILWCRDIKNLKRLILKSHHFRFRKYIEPKCDIDKKIIDFIGR